MKNEFSRRKSWLYRQHRQLTEQVNMPLEQPHGWYFRYRYPVVTAAHVPLHWRFDFNPHTNPRLLERCGVNATLNPGAIRLGDRFLLMVRVEGADRKSYFAVAESARGTQGFQFWDEPVLMPETDLPDTNIYDMRLVEHEDGWIYGLFCTERKDPAAPAGDESMAVAQCGIARTRDLRSWERLPDLVTPSAQQRNVVLHPEFVKGQYAFYTRPQDSFIEAGRGGGIGFGLAPDITRDVIPEEQIIYPRVYHTVSELKNGQGPAPLRTSRGWLHLAHGVRATAAGLRYVLYLFLTDLKDPARVIARPGGYFMAPEGEERTGDVSNVLFCNGWVADEAGTVYIYYASSDTRIHVATTSLEILLDYVLHTPPDGYRSTASVAAIQQLIQANGQTEDTGPERPVVSLVRAAGL